MPFTYRTIHTIVRSPTPAERLCPLSGTIFDALCTLYFLFVCSKIIRFDKLGMGLLPYGHDGQSHFWVGTSPFICTLLAVLPKDIKILVARNAKVDPHMYTLYTIHSYTHSRRSGSFG
jgi:hypothetical protein